MCLANSCTLTYSTAIIMRRAVQVDIGIILDMIIFYIPRTAFITIVTCLHYTQYLSKRYIIGYLRPNKQILIISTLLLYSEWETL